MTTKNMAIVSLVCGIVGIVGSFIPYVSYIAPLCAIAGIVFGALALKNVKAGNCEGNEKGLATAGLVLGIVSTAVSVLMFAALSALYVQQLPFSLPLQTADLS